MTNLYTTEDGHVICKPHADQARQHGYRGAIRPATDSEAERSDNACCDCLADRLEDLIHAADQRRAS